MMGAARAGFYKKRISNSNLVTPSSPSKSKIVNSTQSPLSSSSNRLSVPSNPPLRKRSGSAPAIRPLTLATTWNLKREHVRALKMTWARLCEPPRSNCRGIVLLLEKVWEKLDSKDKDVRNIFYNAAFVDSMQERCERRRSGSIATLRDHTHFFVSLVSQVVMSLEIEPTKILEHLDSLGQNHAYLKQYGFKSKHWEKVGEYFVDIVVIQDCVRGFPEASRAWTMLISSIVDRLRAAPRRGSFATPESRRGSTCSIFDENCRQRKCPVFSISPHDSASNLSSFDKDRRDSIILPATTIDLSSIQHELPEAN
ncbi:unnamed protein product [Caenorhabditis bovis]|uniref:Globin family profile domain-containing protein n=1 Tax=Caenorhabditis bovis TaxID=2654633 RepID=A0A8S1EC91_9PELO|nr:unnamed protein product [Caenorhabditis bovis]